jgi:hypothetical protein
VYRGRYGSGHFVATQEGPKARDVYAVSLELVGEGEVCRTLIGELSGFDMPRGRDGEPDEATWWALSVAVTGEIRTVVERDGIETLAAVVRPAAREVRDLADAIRSKVWPPLDGGHSLLSFET